MNGTGFCELQPGLFGLVTDMLANGRAPTGLPPRIRPLPAVRFTLQAPVRIPSGTWTVIQWDRESAAPGRFTCPADGLYLVTLNGTFAPRDGGVRSLAVRRNRVMLCAGAACAVLAPLRAVDSLEGLAYHNSGAPLWFGGDEGTGMSITRMA